MGIPSASALIGSLYFLFLDFTITRPTNDRLAFLPHFFPLSQLISAGHILSVPLDTPINRATYDAWVRRMRRKTNKNKRMTFSQWFRL